MTTFELRASEPLVVWVPNRDQLAHTSPARELESHLKGMQVDTRKRVAPGMPDHVLVLSVSEQLPDIPAPLGNLSEDAFQVDVQPTQIILTAATRRGLFYAVWQLLEEIGWRWPTPHIATEPSGHHWSLSCGQTLHQPAMPKRLFYAEQLDLSPQLIRWLARHRINTLFPSNPTSFSHPETQFPDDSLQLAEDLGLNFIVGGDCREWLLAGAQIDPQRSWESLTDSERQSVIATAGELWQEMANPANRLAIWPDHPDQLNWLISGLLEAHCGILLETGLPNYRASDDSQRVLYHLTDLSPFGHLPPAAEHPPNDVSRYLLTQYSRWDEQFGSVLSPLLWKAGYDRIRHAQILGMDGVCLGATKLSAHAYFERNGFALATLARTMWAGGEWSAQTFMDDLIHSQFEAAAGVVQKFLRELELWVEAVAPVELSAQNQNQLATVHQVLTSEKQRDQLDQIVSELEESPPTEATIELARALTVLVGFYDLEEREDQVEERALARTIWDRAMVELWPRWLQDCSPLAERLRPLL